MRYLISVYILTLAALLAFCWFYKTVAGHYTTPLSEIEVRNRRPRSAESMYIATHCPNDLNEKEIFLACRSEVHKRIYGSESE